ncbi:transcription factor LBX1a [Synchiropus picturatus]
MTLPGWTKRPGRHNPLDLLPPPATSNKPLTPFSIEDILNKPSAMMTRGCKHVCAGAKAPSAGRCRPDGPLLSDSSPLSALEELASKTFRGLEVSVLQTAEGAEGVSLLGHKVAPRKRRKSRTAFTNHQVFELEKRFLYQKYLSPADRDQIALQLGLTHAQVITWFQNRRAKLKRDLEEMKADVESAKAAGAGALEKLARLAELERCADGVLGLDQPEPEQEHTATGPNGASSLRVEPESSSVGSEEEIQVDD